VVLEKDDTKTKEKTAVKRVAEHSAAEPECKVQKSETAPSTDIEPVTGKHLFDLFIILFFLSIDGIIF
ncbi:hypothetical protein scyTo_0023454, partial [Scyliorhinus torazame]|nr:hypothetical protein [Scyliorhinus torazame]